MRNSLSHNKYYFSFMLAGLFLFGGAHYAGATISPMDCEGPYALGQQFDATSVGSPYDPDPTPKNNQFSCAYGAALGDTAVPPNTYRCEETSGQKLYCKNYINPAVDYYTCTYYGTGAHIGAFYYSRVLFDNCVHSLVPPTLSFSAIPLSINLGQSATLSWTSTNATSCTASGGWSGAQAISGSQPVTPIITTTYALACTGAGTVNQSVTVTVIIPDTISPSVPGALTAAAISPSQINLTWSPSTDTGGSGLAGYRVERCMGVGCASFIQIASVAAVSFSDAGLVPSTSYSYRVRAYDGANNQSGYSNIATDITQTPPDATPPSAPSLSGVAFSSTQINLTWTASTDTGGSGLAGYRVYRGGALIASVGNTVTAYSDSGLTPSTAYSYYVAAYDGAGNATQSNTANVSTPAMPDTTPPVFTFSAPAATLPVGTTFATLAGSTDETATCRYATASGLAFTSMTLFSATAGLNHSQSITGLTDGAIYTYYVKCRDTAGNTNAADVTYMFQVSSPSPDTTPPVISSGAPTGTLAAGTISAIMSVITNENAYCRYNQNSDITFALMTNALNSADLQNHSVSLTGLTNGSSYLYYIRCQDTPGGNANMSGYAISFSVAFPANVNPIALMTATPTSGTAPLAVSADGSTSYDTDGSIAQYVWNWGDGTPNTLGVPSASHTYAIAGTYMLSLTVIDNQGGSGNASQTITVTAAAVPPPPSPQASICTAACMTSADCAPNICGPMGICIAPGGGPGPVRSDGYLSHSDGSMSQPTPASFPSGTASVIMSMKTDVNADCQYSTFINTPYNGSVMNTFSTTGTTAHAVTLTGLAKITAATHDYYIRCRDSSTGVENTTDYPISFTTNTPTIVTGPNPYICFINSNFVRNNIPYLFDICTPK